MYLPYHGTPNDGTEKVLKKYLKTARSKREAELAAQLAVAENRRAVQPQPTHVSCSIQ